MITITMHLLNTRGLFKQGHQTYITVGNCYTVYHKMFWGNISEYYYTLTIHLDKT